MLSLRPVTFREACAFVKLHHRHHRPPVGHKFSVGVQRGGELVGVAMVGRPVAKTHDNGYTLEVNRTCTDGSRNANSMLYGAAWRAARALGYTRVITYTQDGECGASLRASGFVMVAKRKAHKGWSVPSRPRPNDATSGVERILWQIPANP